MGIAIPMLDLMFFLTENQDNPRHVGAVLIFERPRRGGARVLNQIIEAYRRATPVPPFNRIPVLLRAGLPEWHEVDDLDMNWHVQQRTLPAPGSDAQLDALVAELHAPMLERTRPGWRVFFIDGLERNRFAIFIKVHHSLVDGESGIALVHRSLSHVRSGTGASGTLIETSLPAPVKALPDGAVVRDSRIDADEGCARSPLAIGWGSERLLEEGLAGLRGFSKEDHPTVHGATDADERADPQRAGDRAHGPAAAGDEVRRARMGIDVERRRAVRARRRHESLPAQHRPARRARVGRDLPGLAAGPRAEAGDHRGFDLLDAARDSPRRRWAGACAR